MVSSTGAAIKGISQSQAGTWDGCHIEIIATKSRRGLLFEIFIGQTKRFTCKILLL
jgi:hypothetical protein